MSTLKVDNIRHNNATSDAITMASDGTCTARITGMTGGGALSHRNLVVNGAMNVAQRGQVTGIGHASGGAGEGFGGPDRFQFQSNYSIATMSQSTDVPSGQGFAKSLKLDVTTAGGDSNAATYTQLDYRFEGQELTRLKYGTSSAETTTLCFWIKSPKAGIHWVRLYGDELSHSGGGAAFISRKYTVSSANTWQKVTLRFPGFTTDGFNNDNTLGMRLSWYFAQGSAYSSGTAQADDGDWLNWGDANDRARNTVGQVNCFDSTSNDIFITGVQFEVGDTPTSFEHRTYTDELLRCQRYFTYVPSGTVFPGRGNSGSSYIYSYQSTVPMRVSPTIGVSNDIAHGTFSVRRYRDGTGVSDSTSTPTTSSTYFSPNSNMIHLIQGGFSGADDRSATLFVGGGAITISAEL